VYIAGEGVEGEARAAMERYRKGEVLGEGTYGKVVKAEEIATGRVVAIKKVLRLRSRWGAYPALCAWE